MVIDTHGCRRRAARVAGGVTCLAGVVDALSSVGVASAISVVETVDTGQAGRCTDLSAGSASGVIGGVTCSAGVVDALLARGVTRTVGIIAALDALICGRVAHRCVGITSAIISGIAAPTYMLHTLPTAGVPGAIPVVRAHDTRLRCPVADWGWVRAPSVVCWIAPAAELIDALVPVRTVAAVGVDRAGA